MPPGLAATHNFTMDHDPNDIDHYLDGGEDNVDPNPRQPQENEFGTLVNRAVTQQKKIGQ